MQNILTHIKYIICMYVFLFFATTSLANKDLYIMVKLHLFDLFYVDLLHNKLYNNSTMNQTNGV